MIDEQQENLSGIEPKTELAISKGANSALSDQARSIIRTIETEVHRCIDGGLLEEARVFSKYHKKFQRLQDFLESAESLSCDNLQKSKEFRAQKDIEEWSRSGNLEFEGAFLQNNEKIPNWPLK